MIRKATILVIACCFLGVICHPKKGNSDMNSKTKETRMEAMTEIPMMVSTMASDMVTNSPSAKALTGSSEMMMMNDMTSTMSTMDMSTRSMMTKDGKMEGKHKHR